MHIIQSRNIPHAYDQLMRLIWHQGTRKVDQRGDETRELKHVFVEITTDDTTFPQFGPTTQIFGDDFANGLINDEIAAQKGEDFDYGYGGKMRTDDALQCAIDLLNNMPESRRTVIPMFHPVDMYRALCNSEVPCATQFYLDIEDDKLNMTLMMRSNDVPGAFPSDVYGFRRLQEHIAEQTNNTVGKYMHYANNAHIIMNNDGDFVKEFVKTPVNWS